MAHSSFRTKLSIFRYHFAHWFFSWRLDSEGDMGLLIANMLFLVKYKEHTIVSWLNPFKTHELRLAPKHGGSFRHAAYFNHKTSMIHFTNANAEFSEMLLSYCRSTSPTDGYRAMQYFDPDSEYRALRVFPTAVYDSDTGKVTAVKADGVVVEDLNRFVRMVLDRFKTSHEGGVVLPTHS